ncbi:alpha/beta fold hydrolase [Nocardioides koreensis]|uniref:Alpha/beta fold hydrolase n=1 Tax=Nocardioides koreensis TaxID=433651 RepID=A0ABN2ZIL1_9ACTN
MDQIEVEGLRVAYERAGTGPAVALGHGFVGDGRSTWARQIETLSANFTVVAWDAPGAGSSSDPPAGFRVADYADCWASFLRALGLTRVHLVGLSFGGIVALSVVERHPALPASLTLVGGYAGWRGSLPGEEVDARLRTCLRLSELPPEDFARAMLPSMFSATAPEAVVASFLPSVRSFSPAGFRAMALASAEADLRDGLAQVGVPTLLVHGDHDVRAPMKTAEEIRAVIPSSRLVVLPGVGHVATVEAPDAVSRELGDFLASVDDGRWDTGR